MPSPFPGMDPYLEGSLWTAFHVTFAIEIVRQIAPQLRPRYLALPVERVVFEEVTDVAVTTTSLYPDVSVVSPSPPPEPTMGGASTVLAPPLQMATVVPQAVPHVSIEIRDVAQRRLVTAIEIVSPTNERGEGRAEYLAKRRRLLLSSAHLIEIDLLRSGERVPMQQPLPPAHYFVVLSRAEKRPLVDVWPLTLRDRLPIVPIPLLAGDDDLPLALQAAFDATYDLLGCDLLIDYRQPPEQPLSDEDAAWVETLLRSHGVRGA